MGIELNEFPHKTGSRQYNCISGVCKQIEKGHFGFCQLFSLLLRCSLPCGKSLRIQRQTANVPVKRGIKRAVLNDGDPFV
jgi:hypothetical protein